MPITPAASTSAGLRVVVVTKGAPEEANTSWAQGGVAVVRDEHDPGDSVAAHVRDTLVAGADLCDPAAVELLLAAGPDAVRRLIGRGATFDTGPGGLLRTREGGHTANRVIHAGGDATGAEIERALLQLRDLELNIVSVVRGFLRNIETNRQRVTAARVATELARRRLEAEQKKFQVGTSTSFDVLLFQERYVNAITVETQAVIDLNRAFLGLQQAVGVTLEVNGIRVENGEAILGETMFLEGDSNLPVAPVPPSQGPPPPQIPPSPPVLPTPHP